MNPQVLLDDKGNETGVFIPMEEWLKIKAFLPQTGNLAKGIPDWQKDILDERLADIENHPEKFRPIHELFESIKVS